MTRRRGGPRFTAMRNTEVRSLQESLQRKQVEEDARQRLNQTTSNQKICLNIVLHVFTIYMCQSHLICRRRLRR
jgi:hypothetical protein